MSQHLHDTQGRLAQLRSLARGDRTHLAMVEELEELLERARRGELSRKEERSLVGRSTRALQKALRGERGEM